MKRAAVRFGFTFGLAAILCCSAQTITIRGVTIVDVQQRQLLPNRNVTVTSDRITSITQGPLPPNTGTVISGAGKFLIPGLWDMHADLATDPAAFVARGITGVRERGTAALEPTLSLYRDIESGKVTGPRLITGGPGIQASTPAEARDAFDRLFETDADFVRFPSNLDYEAYIALAERSRKWRYQLVGPLPPSVRLRDAISLRQSSFEGIEGLDRLTREEACSGFSAAAVAGAWFTPTLASQRPRNRKKAESLVRLMLECGAPVLAGGGVHEELEALVEAGYTPFDALRTATWEPARFLRNEEVLGSIATGKFADLVLLDANPIEDIANLSAVSAVILRGKYFGKSALTTLRRPPTIRWWTNASTSVTPIPAASSAKPPASSARPASPTR